VALLSQQQSVAMCHVYTSLQQHSAHCMAHLYAGSNIVVEEFLEGEEASFFALLDGSTCLALASAQVPLTVPGLASCPVKSCKTCKRQLNLFASHLAT